MEVHKKLGTIAMVLSVVLALAFVVFSENICHPSAPAAQSISSWLSLCVRFVVYEEITGNQFSDHIYISANYLMLTCALIFAVGFLWFSGALPLPARAKTPPPKKDE